MVVRQHDLIATQPRTATAGQAPQPRPPARRQRRPALDASRRRSYPGRRASAVTTWSTVLDPLNVRGLATPISNHNSAAVPKTGGAQRNTEEEKRAGGAEGSLGVLSGNWMSVVPSIAFSWPRAAQARRRASVVVAIPIAKRESTRPRLALGTVPRRGL